MTEKIYCYVDETGQDTEGDLFIVSVVVSGVERDQVRELCEKIEMETRKGQVKWIKADFKRKVEYVRRILQEPIFNGKLNFAVYRNRRDYLALTVLTVARTIVAVGQKDYKATVLVDGLPRSQEKWIGSELRHLYIRIRKVRGMRRDENDALIRLADAICGFVRAALEGQEAMRELFEQGKRNGLLKEV
jgi:hypothetical protein